MQAEDGGAAEASGGVTSGRAGGRLQSEGQAPEGEPPRAEGQSGGRRKAKWKLKFHHQALPPEYLDHYEAALAQEAARGGCPAQQRTKARKGPQAEAGPAEAPAESKPPRRGRKPKKADICHVVSGGGGAAGGSLLARRLTQAQDEPLNLCIRDLGRVRVKEEPPEVEAEAVAAAAVPLPPEAVCWSPLFVHPIALQAPAPAPHLLLCEGQAPPAPPPPRAKRPAPAAPGGRRKRSAIFIPPTTADNATEVSICKFKFTGGARPSLEEKKMLSVDAGGNLRFYSGSDKGGGFFPTALPAPSPQPPPPPPEQGPSSTAADEGPSTTTGAGRRKRRTRKSLARERLEQTFREKGFLIQTQQLESAEGATYCKFRQLRKFTRYLFRSWKDYLPGSVKEMTGTPPGPEPRPPHQ